MSTRELNYWGYRIDTENRDFFWDELKNCCRLRQGWGYKEWQDLTCQKNPPDRDKKANRKIFDSVKKGDILLIPRISDWNKVAVVEATEDFDKGYKFKIDAKHKDYGHIFPAKFERSFVRESKHVDGAIRSTLRTPMRFWSMERYADSIEKIRKAEKEGLQEVTGSVDRVQSAIDAAFEVIQEKFKEQACKNIHEQLQSAEWEYGLVEILQKLYPQYDVEKVGGKSESDHGTDILMRLPGPVDEKYGIAIQVKDHEGQTGKEVIDQIKKADDYWLENKGLKIIEKVVIITKGENEENSDLTDNTDVAGIKFIFKDGLEDLIEQYAIKYIGSNLL